MDLRKKRNIQEFNGERYSTWKFRIKSLLEELQVLSVVEDAIPSTPDAYWKQKNMIAKGTIIEYLSDAFLNFAKDSTTAKSILDNLDKIYERKSLASQLALRKQLLNLKLQPDVPLLQHFTKFDNIVTELISAGAKLDEMDKISHLLLTLPTSYDGVITALETLGEDHLHLAFVKTRLLDYEVKIKAENTTELKVLHAGTKRFSIQNSTIPHKIKKYNPQRKYKYGPGNSTHKMTRMYCDHCGRRNHFKKDCRFFKNQQQNGPSTSNSYRTANNIQPCSGEEGGFAFMFSKCKLPAAAENRLSNNEICFLLDSGATDHIVNTLDAFTTYVELPTPLKIGVAKNGTSILAFGKGRIEVNTNLGIPGCIEEVLYSPEVRYNLLSVNRIQKTGMSVIFGNNGVQIYDKNNKCYMTGENTNNLFSIIFEISKPQCNLNESQNKCQDQTKLYNLWHNRLGHLNKQRFNLLKNVIDENDSKIINEIIPNDELCEPCILGKQSRLPFAKSKDKCNKNNRPLFIIHSDVCGPITPVTVDDKNYFVTFTDDYSRYTVTYLMHYKSEVLKCFQDFVAKSENLFNLKVTNLYCDNGREYLSNEFKDFCVCKGITYHLTVPYTPQQNGVAERKNRTLTEMARTLVTSAKLDKSFWGEAILTATYLTNRLPSKALTNNKTPYEYWHNRKPKINHLRMFGSTAYVHDKTRRSKFDEKSFKAILVGYDQNGYKLFNSETNQFLTARDIVIDESNFESSRPVNDDNLTKFPAEINKPNNNELAKLIGSKHKHLPGDNSEATSSSKLRRSQRILDLPAKDYKQMNDPDFFLSLSTVLSLPTTYNEIFSRNDTDEWLKAIQSELDSLNSNQTWTLIDKPDNVNIVSSKWVFTIKNNELGEPTRYKARLVARGFTQEYLQDFEETFAPVARISTLRFVLALANQYDLYAHHMDVKTAFLNGILKEDIYMEVPEGVPAQSNQVCKLNKSLYGLKQSSRCWFELFDSTLKEIGFKSSLVDPCLYILDKNSIDKNIYIVLYVDDLIICAKNKQDLLLFKKCLMQKFDMTDLNEIKMFLGIRIERNNGKLTLDQSLYLKNVLSKFSMSDCNSCNSPFASKLDYAALNSDTHCEGPCRNVIGCLMYAMLCTRPDLCAAVGIFSRYQSKNNEELWKCLKHLLRYIKGTVDLKLTYEKCDYKQLIVGYVDSDWGGDLIDRKSTTGHLFKVFDNCTISWNTRKQNSVAASSTEAEYMALFEAAREAIWLKSLLNSISILVIQPITIFEDNNSCISIANNPTNHKRSKHIDIKYHFTREQIVNKIIKLEYISTGNQLADIFTKMVPTAKFLELRRKLNLI